MHEVDDKTRSGAAGHTVRTMALIAAGLGGVVIGCLLVNLWIIAAGVACMAAAQAVHRAARRRLSLDLRDWALDAVEGVGPCPPRHVQIMLAEDVRTSDFKTGYQLACRSWAIEQRSDLGATA